MAKEERTSPSAMFMRLRKNIDLQKFNKQFDEAAKKFPELVDLLGLTVGYIHFLENRIYFGRGGKTLDVDDIRPSLEERMEIITEEMNERIESRKTKAAKLEAMLKKSTCNTLRAELREKLTKICNTYGAGILDRSDVTPMEYTRFVNNVRDAYALLQELASIPGCYEYLHIFEVAPPTPGQ
ncbi:MAG: hypothetical protein RTU92_02490 [Candidatus Thorarchaeota archaeon]